MFVDASAMVAILTRETQADAFADVLEQAHAPITSAIAVFETGLGLCRKRHASVDEAESDVGDFLTTTAIEVVPITAAEAASALVAFARYGKGRGHPA
ncbi:MAG TPA: type II toxin-antitoxin system VapC family toxin [Acetobacteraceae bacterium]|nr:type II toxin-antitoxin system VapC family toxin [Acetobacteraceae bacterium]